MRVFDVIAANAGIMTLREDLFVTEMANFLADVTDLPANVVLWTKTQPDELPHTKYRMKGYKDRIHVATLTIGSEPSVVWEVNTKRYKLDAYELEQAKTVIANYAPLFIQLIDGMLTTDDVKYQIKRIRGAV